MRRALPVVLVLAAVAGGDDSDRRVEAGHTAGHRHQDRRLRRRPRHPPGGARGGDGRRGLRHRRDFSQAEPEAVRGRVDSEPDALRSVGLEVTSSYIDVFENRVVFGFLYADEAALRWVDDRYGGAVELQSFLKPA